MRCEGNKSVDWMINFTLSIDSWNLLVLEFLPRDLQDSFLMIFLKLAWIRMCN